MPAPPKPVPKTTAPLELLAPAGDWECVRAAVENGADAVYFGLERFNARMRAKNFTLADLPELMAFLHLRGVRGYVTFNTLVFEPELADARDHLQSIISAGVDAAIVQDVGLCRMIRDLSPDFPIHASTQMTISSANGVAFARELGCNLVVLARECSLNDLNRIREEQLREAGGTPLPLEVFVHGALCVAYSGQCLTSEVLGGRSANRGECAQACRMPYELISDGRKVDLGDRRYLLSPQDLSGVEVLPDLIRSGVASLKIEGRLKSPDYVASVVRVYRSAIDRVLETIEGKTEVDPDQLREESRYELEMSFSRGLYTGWFRGNNNQELAHARFGKKRGVFLGTVLEVGRNDVRIRLENDLKPGDGIVFDHGTGDNEEQGGRVFTVNAGPHTRSGALVTFGRGAVDLLRVHAGDLVWKTSDPELQRRVRRTFEGERPRFQRPVSMEVHGHAGSPLTLIVRDEAGRCVRADSKTGLSPAETAPLTTERIKQQLARLGGTPFCLGELDNRVEGEVILPISELNQLRRDAIARLEQLRAKPPRWSLRRPTIAIPHGPAGVPERTGHAELVVLTRSLTQLEAALEEPVTTLYCDFENPKDYRHAVRMVRASNATRPRPVPAEVFVAPPRIFKMGEDWILEQVRSCEPDGFLVRNYDHLKQFRDARMIGDFSLNIANSISADYFKHRFQLERLTASYDLNADQLESLLKSAPAEWFEITLHQHMPMFHMEHCVFCAFLSSGRDYRDCGRPCDRHSVSLRDRVGMEHPLKADVGCRNTLFNARAQTGAEYFARFHDLGVRRFRIEFVNESGNRVKETLAVYRSLLQGRITGSDLWKQLKLQNQLGITRGQMGR